jgi:hypothetical protein
MAMYIQIFGLRIQTGFMFIVFLRTLGNEVIGTDNPS